MDNKNIAFIIFTCEEFFAEAEILINRLNKMHISNYFTCYLASKNISKLKHYSELDKWEKIDIPVKKNTWGKEAKFLVNQLKEDYFFLYLDDLYPIKNIDFKSLSKVIKKAIFYKPSLIRLNTKTTYRKLLKELESNIFKEQKSHKYLTSTVFGIFNKEFFKMIIKKSDNIWNFERQSSKRYCFDDQLFIFIKSPYIKYINLVVKGKILNLSFLRLESLERKYLLKNSLHRKFNIIVELLYFIKLTISRLFIYPFNIIFK